MKIRTDCCDRVTSDLEMLEVPPALRALLDVIPRDKARAVGVDLSADRLCGNCVQQLMRRHRAFGGRALLPRRYLAAATTAHAAPDRARWNHEAIDEVAQAWIGDE